MAAHFELDSRSNYGEIHASTLANLMKPIEKCKNYSSFAFFSLINQNKKCNLWTDRTGDLRFPIFTLTEMTGSKITRKQRFSRADSEAAIGSGPDGKRSAHTRNSRPCHVQFALIFPIVIVSFIRYHYGFRFQIVLCFLFYCSVTVNHLC